MLESTTALRYVTPLREGGSLPGIVEAEDYGTYVVKFHGAGQGPKVLVAEAVVGELAPRLWAIDHGAALYFHHAWTNEERFSLQPYDATDHILRAYAVGIGAADEELAPAVTEDLLTEVVGLVPEEWLASDTGHPSVEATR